MPRIYEPLKQGQKVKVSGPVKWGDLTIRASTSGIIQEWKKGPYALVTLNYVDGDYGVTIHVLKYYIKKLNEDE